MAEVPCTKYTACQQKMPPIYQGQFGQKFGQEFGQKFEQKFGQRAQQKKLSFWAALWAMHLSGAAQSYLGRAS